MKEYIEKDAARDLMERALEDDWEIQYANDRLRDIPAADVVEARNGKWIEENTRPRSSQFCCSVCHRTAYDPQPTRVKDWKKRCRYAYCPNCGCAMEETE